MAQPRILIIDCEPQFVDLAEKTFADSYMVSCATNHDDGWHKASREPLDIIVLGYLEPRGTSHRFAMRLAEEKTTSQIPVLIVDVRPEEYARKGWRWSDGFSHNVKGYVWRPIDKVELKKTVEGVLQRAKAGTMSLTEVAQQTEEMLKRIDQLKKLLMSQPES